MFELLELILSILQDFFAIDNNDSVADITPSESGNKPTILATSPSPDGGGEPKKPVSDSAICKELTYRVTEIYNSGWKPVTVIEETDGNGRKHVAVAAGGNFSILGD